MRFSIGNIVQLNYVKNKLLWEKDIVFYLFIIFLYSLGLKVVILGNGNHESVADEKCPSFNVQDLFLWMGKFFR